MMVASLMLDGEVTAISARLASRVIVPITQTSRPSRSAGVGWNLPRWSPGMRAEKVWRGKAQASIDDAHRRYFVVHLHRLLDPDESKP